MFGPFDIWAPGALAELDATTRAAQSQIWMASGLKRGQCIWVLVDDENLARDLAGYVRAAARQIRPSLLLEWGYNASPLRHTRLPITGQTIFYRQVTSRDVAHYSISKED